MSAMELDAQELELIARALDCLSHNTEARRQRYLRSRGSDRTQKANAQCDAMADSCAALTRGVRELRERIDVAIDRDSERPHDGSAFGSYELDE